MDRLDERSFSLSDIREFCLEFFAGQNQLSLRNPAIDFEGFIEDLQLLVDKEKLVWNPLKNKLCPWVDVNKLRLTYHAKTHKETNKASLRSSMTYGSKPKPASIPRRSSDPPETGDCSRLESRKQTMDMASLRSSMPNMSKTMPKSGSQWSYEGPSYKKLKPLDVLLVVVPNSFVESHEYYFKWKTFSKDAFSGESGDGLKELLKRASRKSELFFHPDKLPSDLTESQDLLFKSIWDVMMESEATLQ
jgi:hypothetical protein